MERSERVWPSLLVVLCPPATCSCGVRIVPARRSTLCDVVNCSDKKGSTVLAVCEKQWARFGCYRADCVSGVGDGGGYQACIC